MPEVIRKHKLLTELAVLVLLCILMLMAIEIRQPYFFLQDDNADSYICQYVYSLESVFKGEFPLYNFHQFAGIGFLDRGQTGQLNPFVYIGGVLSYIFLGHFNGTVDFVAGIYLIVGAVGFYLILKKLNLGQSAATVGAIAWSFNSFSIYCGSNWIIAIILTGIFPWIVLTSQNLIHEDGFKPVVLAAVAKTLLFYGGHPQYFIYAIIFDFIFAITTIVLSNDKGIRLKPSLRYTWKYFLSGILTTLWSLPLLVPMLNAMNQSSTRSSALIFDDFIEAYFRAKDFIIGQYNPVMQYDTTGSITLPDGRETGVIEALVAIQKNMSHVGFLMFFAAVMGIVIVILRFKNKDQETHDAVCKMLTCIPAFLIAFLWASSTLFNRIIYLIPIINRFRYPFKVMQYALFFMILLASICLNYLLNNLYKNRDRLLAALKIALPAVEAVNLVAIYLILPIRYFGVYTLSQKPFEDEATEMLRGSRYAFVGGAPEYWDFWTLERVGKDATATLGYNYATYFGLSNIGGYDVLLPKESCYSLYEMLENMSNVSGNIAVYDYLVEDMSAHGVEYYICLIENKDDMAGILQDYVIELVYEDEIKAIFQDPYAVPLMFTIDNNEALALDYEEHVNYLRVVTPDDFAGGTIVANYTHDPHFVATVDGQETFISNPGNYENMIIENIAPGSHEVIYKYVDKTFEYSVIVSLAGTVIIVAAYLSTRFMKNKQNYSNNGGGKQ